MPGAPMADRAPVARRLDFSRIKASGGSEAIQREIAVESPVSLEFNGIGYAVLMATPNDLGDLVYGFALAERLIDEAADIIDFDSYALPIGLVVRITLVPDRLSRIEGRIRHRISESSCGLCGIENLEQALRPLPKLSARCDATDAAIFRALDGLGAHQALNRATGAVHAAAACSAEGEVLLVREDVGRHNAFDKLIGAMLRASISWGGGFALLSSRCSYELVEKAVLAECPLLATISAPTSLAVERAAAAGLPLRVLARSDALLAYAGDAA